MIEWLLILLIGSITFVGGLILGNLLPAYMRKKGENLATKEDIGTITKEIESIKSELSINNMIKNTQWNLKREACIEALEIIDMQLSHQLVGNFVVKEEQDTIKARRCHNKLLITCDSTALINKFNEIVFGVKVDDGKHILQRLNEFRNLIRKELGFGEKLKYDEEYVWFAGMHYDKRLGNCYNKEK